MNHAQNQQTGGYAATVDLLTGASAPTPILNLPAGFRLAQTFTVEFGISQPQSKAAPGTPGNFNCVATIQWVENGNQVQRRVSVGSGTTVTGSGTGVQVSVQDNRLGAGYESGLGYQVTAILSPGPRAAFGTPPILQDSVTIVLAAGLSGINIPVPQDAGISGIEALVVDSATPQTAPSMYIEAQDFAGNNLKVWHPDNAQRVLLPPNTRNLRVINVGASPTVNFSYSWIVNG
jgi:hypothetical protein